MSRESWVVSLRVIGCVWIKLLLTMAKGYNSGEISIFFVFLFCKSLVIKFMLKNKMLHLPGGRQVPSHSLLKKVTKKVTTRLQFLRIVTFCLNTIYKILKIDRMSLTRGIAHIFWKIFFQTFSLIINCLVLKSCSVLAHFLLCLVSPYGCVILIWLTHLVA